MTGPPVQFLMRSDFVPLHVHSQYSLLDGAIRVKDLAETAREYKMPAVAITDHGNMFGAVDFYEKIRAAGIKPIVGCEMYVAENSRLERVHGKGNHHLILLVRDADGYRNLVRLVSASYTEGFYYKPRIDKDLLERHSGGLVALSSCMHGEVASLLLQGDTDGAREAALWYKHVFGPENYYIELQANGLPEQERANKLLVELAKDIHAPLVATNDCHYLRREDARAHDALLCIQTGKTLNDPKRMKFSTEELYFKSPEEMKAAFREVPEAVTNTRAIAERCNFDFDLKSFHLPRFDVPEGTTLATELRNLAGTRLRRRLQGEPPPEYAERLEQEFGIIEQMGFPGYFLIVGDFIDYAKSQGIPVGPGRGSAAGSLVAYALGITDLDPIKYDLLFERFLNPERISMPDIDVDFCMDRRGEVIEYVTEKYGGNHVAQIITFGTLQARGVLRDVGRVLDVPYAEVDKVAKLVPDKLKITLDDALSMEPELKDLYNSNAQVREMVDIGRRLEGLNRHASTHAAGVVISPEPLVSYLPLYRASEEEQGNVTQFDMSAVEKLGLLKFDFLGLKTLTVIDKAERLINQGREENPFSVSAIPMDDEETFKLLSSGTTSGVFQLESAGMRELLVKMRPENFEDIIALVALYRPGPLGAGMAQVYVDCKHGRQKVTYLHPELEPILKETYGVILYQEQVMRIANVLAGYSLGEADLLRRAMGKKKREVMEEQADRFVRGCRERGIPEGKAEKIFRQIEHFAGYGFNKSHSAAYALIAYQTAYLKAHYPVEFMAALLSCDMDNTDKVSKYIHECRDMAIEVLPPDVNISGREFNVVGQSIRFGLEAVKGVGGSAIEAIIQARESKGEFADLGDFCLKADLRKVNRKVVESLIFAGAFDSTGLSRAQLAAQMDRTMDEAGRRQRTEQAGQMGFFDAEPVAVAVPDVEEWDHRELLRREKEALGFYITGHPLDPYERELAKLVSARVADLPELSDGSEVTIGGVVAGVKNKFTKKGDRMATCLVEDQTGAVNTVIFPDLYREINGSLVEDAPVLVTGSLQKDDRGIGLRARSLQLLGALRASGLRILVDTDAVDAVALADLKTYLERNTGDCPVSLVLVSRGNWRVNMVTRLSVAPSLDLLHGIVALMGPGSAHLVRDVLQEA